MKQEPTSVAVAESVEFAAPFHTRCPSCSLEVRQGERLSGARKTREHQAEAITFVYQFPCSRCGALIAFSRRAGTRVYELWDGDNLERAVEVKDDGGGFDLTAEMHRRAEERRKCATQSLTQRHELEGLRADRDAKFADDVGTREKLMAHVTAPGESKAGKKKKLSGVKKKKKKQSSRSRNISAALGVDKAAVVQRAARALRKRGVDLSSLTKPH